VRALMPAAMCQRGADFSSRDVSGRVAEALAEEGLPVTAGRG
jgi:hypothetical protein